MWYVHVLNKLTKSAIYESIVSDKENTALGIFSFLAEAVK